MKIFSKQKLIIVFVLIATLAITSCGTEDKSEKITEAYFNTTVELISIADQCLEGSIDPDYAEEQSNNLVLSLESEEDNCEDASLAESILKKAQDMQATIYSKDRSQTLQNERDSLAELIGYKD